MHTPQQNGVVERKNIHILNIARALRFQSRMPIKYWCICNQTAIYLMNRLNSAVIEGRSPYELLYKKKPSLTHLRVIGCLCYATNVLKGDKFEERARAAVLMGYSETQKSYILLDLHTHQLFVNRYVIFKENEFPFAKASIIVQAKVHGTPAPMEQHILFDDYFLGEKHSNSNVDQGPNVVVHDYAIEDDNDGQSVFST